MEKIQITEGTGQKIRISEHFELLDFELVSLNCILGREKLYEQKMFLTQFPTKMVIFTFLIEVEL